MIKKKRLFKVNTEIDTKLGSNVNNFKINKSCYYYFGKIFVKTKMRFRKY